MAKVKRKHIEPLTLPGPKMRWVKLPKRPMVHLTVDMATDPSSVDLSHMPEDIPEGAIVKVTQSYRAGDEKAANEVLEQLMADIRPKAHFVRAPQRIVIRDTARRIPEIHSRLTPIEAVDVWLTKRQLPDGIDKAEVMREVRAMLEKDEVARMLKERAAPKAFTVKALRLSNWMCFSGEHAAEELPQGLIGIVGSYEGQAGRSNRSGKSSVLDAVLFAPFGETRKVSRADKLIFQSAREATVDVELDTDAGPVWVIRHLERPKGGGSAKTTVSINGTDVAARAANSAVPEMLGMSAEDFMRTCFVRQGELESVLRRGSTELKRDIIRWRGLDVWTALEKEASAALSKASERVQAIDVSMADKQATIGRGRPTDPTVADARKKYEAAVALLPDIRRLKSELSVAKSDRERWAQLDADYLELEGLPKAQAALEKIRKGLEELEAGRTKAAKAASVLEAKRNDISSMRSSGFDGKCPLDGCHCPRTDEINGASEETAKLLSDAASKAKEANAILHQWSQRLREEQDKERELRRRVHMLETIRDRMGELDEPTGKALEAAEKKVKQLDVALAKAQGSLEHVDVDGLRARLDRLVYEVQAFDSARQEMVVLERSRSDAQAKEVLLRYVLLMVGRFGIPSMIVEEALEEIEGQVNSILEEMGTEHRIRFDSQRELLKPAKYCRECGTVYPESARKDSKCSKCGSERGNEMADELRPMVVEGSEEHEFDSDSGAGRGLLALATRVAMSKFLGATVLFLDEVSGMLDSYNLGMFVRLLHQLPGLGFRQVFVVSHQDEVDSALQAKIVVTRHQDEQRSEVGWKALA